MGNLKIGDKIIITKILQPNNYYNYLIGTVQTIDNIDIYEDPYPYRITIKKSDIFFWVEGVPYSSLMLELL